MRRVLAATAVITGLALVTTACSSGSESEAPSSAAAASSAAPASEAPASSAAAVAEGALAPGISPECEAADIEIWGYGDETVPWFAAAMDDWRAAHPDATLKYSYVPFDQITSKLLGTAMTGDGPDGIFYNPNDSGRLYEAGVIGDMSAIWDAYPDAGQFAPATVWRIDDAVVSAQGYVNITALYYNKAILDELGLQPPTTVEEFDAAMAAATAAGYEGLAISALGNGQGEFVFLPWLLGEGLNYDAWDEAKLTEVLTRFKSYFDNGSISPDATSWDINNSWDKWTAGKTLFAHNGNWNLQGIDDKVDFEWGVVELPAGSAGSHSVGGGEGVSIGAMAECPGMVFDLFERMLFSQEAQTTILEFQGSIPSRADAAQSPAMSDPALQVFGSTVANSIARPNSPLSGEYAEKLGAVWNAVAGGQITPEEGAQQIVSELSIN